MLLVLGLGLLAAAFYMQQAPEGRPNSRVTDLCFDRLKSGMTSNDVEAILGAPNRRSQGEVYRLHVAPNPGLPLEIRELSAGKMDHGGNMTIYRGLRGESIEILFDRGNTLLAAQYSIDGQPVLYSGSHWENSESVTTLFSGRVVIGGETRNKIDRFRVQRRERLAAAGTPDSAATSSPTAPQPARRTAPQQSDPSPAVRQP
jgi:hypothetical protein